MPLCPDTELSAPLLIVRHCGNQDETIEGIIKIYGFVGREADIRLRKVSLFILSLKLDATRGKPALRLGDP